MHFLPLLSLIDCLTSFVCLRSVYSVPQNMLESQIMSTDHLFLICYNTVTLKVFAALRQFKQQFMEPPGQSVGHFDDLRTPPPLSHLCGTLFALYSIYGSYIHIMSMRFSDHFLATEQYIYRGYQSLIVQYFASYLKGEVQVDPWEGWGGMVQRSLASSYVAMILNG